ncbi:MAG: ROK family transcriptional regulator [Actinomycetota bacterium]
MPLLVRMLSELMWNTEPTGGETALRISRKATRGDTRTQNRRFVLQRLFADSPTSRADIARATGLTRATVSHLIAELIEEGLVLELGTAPSAGGKPPTLLTISDDAHHVIAVELEGDRWTGSVMTLRGRIIDTLSVDAAGRRGAPAVRAIFELVGALTARTKQHILGVGIATPGVVTPKGRVIEATALDWHGTKVGKLVREQIGIPTYVINDASAIALAEFALGKHGTDNLIVVKVGTGIGAGIILDGRPYAGEGYAAGEIGHMAIHGASFDGTAETLEGVASARSIATQLGLSRDPTRSASDVFEETARRIGSGDAEARRVVNLAGRHVGAALANVTAILDIRHIVVAGPVSRLGSSFLDPLREEISARVLPAVEKGLVVAFGGVERSAEHGAAILVLNRELGIL